eukprot:g2489.t1
MKRMTSLYVLLVGLSLAAKDTTNAPFVLVSVGSNINNGTSTCTHRKLLQNGDIQTPQMVFAVADEMVRSKVSESNVSRNPSFNPAVSIVERILPSRDLVQFVSKRESDPTLESVHGHGARNEGPSTHDSAFDDGEVEGYSYEDDDNSDEVEGYIYEEEENNSHEGGAYIYEEEEDNSHEGGAYSYEEEEDNSHERGAYSYEEEEDNSHERGAYSYDA